MLKLTPITRRRLRAFATHRRGVWSLWLFLAAFLLSLGAEFIANDRPILISYKGEWLFPALHDYPEDKFGGFLAETDYRDPVIFKEIEANGWIIWPPVRYSYNTHNLGLPTPAPSAPTWMLSDAQCAHGKTFDGGAAQTCRDIEWNWLGTDDQGRDVVARLIYGFRISVLFGLLLASISSLVGVAAGAVQGYFGGWTDLLMQRFIEIWSSLPSLYLLIILSAIVTPSFFVLLGILLAFSWVNLVHVVRAEFLRARNFDYVRAARALGLSNRKIMVKHVLPNAMTATLTFLPFILSASITTLTSLDFLGFGLPPGSPSLGELLLQGKSNLQAPWLGLSGFAVIAVTLSLLVFIGEALRDAYDPRKGL
ncbi:microcin C transport system permease protein [Rhodoblastus acidophilus]|uniref:Microcin C transport system permease protein n=1 Tax=Rhodoblastus acidophilus TaxID=1074 RepID=A0A212RMP9_RHOAC|nr:ABC transporter permease [Rhodoblastus acidophilus]PPQ39184.1 ABC transporter permease [Rhodoblastus acidophilus]RAI21072.1 ABC transporter permease [Rhodoblastus acidophilus]SNB73791.1 microcin C transport system permease protein [Rhodoblastus acidophilus]